MNSCKRPLHGIRARERENLRNLSLLQSLLHRWLGRPLGEFIFSAIGFQSGIYVTIFSRANLVEQPRADGRWTGITRAS